mmetsp:Transcript_37041/g.73305  ORF Transcript_37041/g.73305 Transcript_37041/m.73305 type:complete len:163 (-) Transcript_37041:229-717(-)|eukprot:CAMPEP_0172709638 /NCGR_PEP_ID=MMETSP1074-20121228/55183_1 /TAXON_ID=2916 /ORGANISM="Ceratium fusus, Strain PA161109" /LENGTH=162 /DNA_ID=CAMNT_0013532923 /DNA_START=96 /DNA_END=584 /DNA_ORIENTATION=+
MVAAPIARKQLASLWAGVLLVHTLLTNEPDDMLASCDTKTENDPGEHVADVVSLLQESIQMASATSTSSTTSATSSISEEAAVSTSQPQDQICHCAAKAEGEPPSCRGDGETAGILPTPTSHRDVTILQWLVKPYRLRTVGIAVAGFGLLTLDIAPAMLLAF